MLLHLRKSLQWLAKSDVVIFRQYSSTITSHANQTFGYLLLRSWADNPKEFADECAEYLIADPTRLNIGYSSWSGGGEGTGESAISRIAIQAISPHCSPLLFEALETAIIGYCDDYERQTPRFRGYAELLVLRSLDPSRMSRRTALRIEELERKFPDLSDAIVEEDETSLAKCVGPPISQETAALMTDDNWISAMQKYDGSTDRFGGGPVELSRLLAQFARQDRQRFATLVGRIPDTVDPMYFSAILDGICSRYTNFTREEKEVDQQEIAAVQTEVFLNVIDRLHALPGRPCGSAIVGCIEKLSERRLPVQVMDIVSFYATSDPDPEADIWRQTAGGNNYYGGEPYNHGINCDRGQAAQAICSLLYDDESRIDGLRSALHALSEDPVISVRTCAINAFLPLLKIERDWGVELFCKACDNCESICGTSPFEKFVHYAILTHYPQIRSLLQSALNSGNADAVDIVACQITLGELADVDVGADASNIRTGSEAMRAAAAGAYARNLSNEAVGNKCAERLDEFFNDESESVWKQVSRAFWGLSGKRLLELRDFIARFIESKSFEKETDTLLRALEESNVELPDIICRAAERVLDFLGEEGTHIAYHGSLVAHHISTLVVRQYEQTTDDAIKTRCLDLIDRMEQVGYYGIGEELSKVDR
jgi:hypothetical protein